jgi:hypothetical protein
LSAAAQKRTIIVLRRQLVLGVHMRSFIGQFVAAATVLAALALTSAWVFDADDRQRSHSAMIGTLAIDLPEGSGLGTAALVDECGILTSFHVAFGPWYVTTLRAPSHKFVGTFTLTEVTLSDGTHPVARATPVVWGPYKGPDRQLRNPGDDWAYLVLDRCLGRDYGYFRLRNMDADDFEANADGFTAIGYSSGVQMIDPACSVHVHPADGHGVWLHDCALLPGDSGGPILKRNALTIAAIGSSFLSDESDPTCRAQAISVSTVLDWHRNCANIAVPLSWEIIDRIEAAYVAVGVQRALSRLGYDAGPIGAIDETRAIAAIRQVQHNMGWIVTGEPTEALRKILILQLPST